jgi:hypothetical protein
MDQAYRGVTITPIGDETMQKTFNPFSFCFAWTENWYEWDRKAAHKEALKARNEEAKRLQKAGKRVVKFSMPNQLVRKGGINSGKPDIEAVVTCYGLNAY